MLLPFGYAVRNLYRDKTRLVQTLVGSSLVVLLVMSAQALNAGMQRTLRASGSPANLMLLGAGSEESVQRSEVSEPRNLEIRAHTQLAIDELSSFYSIYSFK